MAGISNLTGGWHSFLTFPKSTSLLQVLLLRLFLLDRSLLFNDHLEAVHIVLSQS